MLHRKRFELALQRLAAEDWARFESFASAFLVSEFPELRTVASSGGDEGRDGELFSPDNEPSVVLQYSVTADWKGKVRATARKIRKNLETASQLIYVTNQRIGAAGDQLKRELRTSFNLALDIRDRTFFLDRFEGDSHREQVAENLARDVVDPFLASTDIIERRAQALTPGENRAALVFLELQWEDDTRDKGLTKTAFDALVRMALRSTHADARVTRAHVHQAITALLPAREECFVRAETDKALARLNKRFIRHHQALDEFCLTYEEGERLKERLAGTEVADQALRAEIRAVVQTVMPNEAAYSNEHSNNLVDTCRACVERFLLERGELFVSALARGQMSSLNFETVRKIVERERSQLKQAFGSHTPPDTEAVALAVERVLKHSGPATTTYLRGVADAYTLLAFLRETPDVQTAVQKMFSVGEVWLDTSIILPLLAEDLATKEQWKFRRLIAAAQHAGLKFKATPGVIEEVERHMNRAQSRANWAGTGWRGSNPYLFDFYVCAGHSQSGFSAWLARFRGDARPADDLADYLREFFGVQVADISADASRADDELRRGVKEIWTKIHEERRTRLGQDIDPMVVLRLAEHDAENFVGVIVRRQQENASAFGYTSWWLTLDHMAFKISERVRDYTGIKAPPSPVMSADFLANYLAFGPLRGKVARADTGGLPLAMDLRLIESLTPELVDLAGKVRRDSEGLPEYVIQRKVRDALDQARRRTGDLTMRGLEVQSADVDL